MSYMRQENAADTTAELGTVTHITGHWTAGSHTQTFDHYHFNILGDGTVVQTRPTHGPGSLGSHVWHRNTGNVGIGICAMAPGVPITSAQIQATARLIAELMGVFGVALENVVDHVWWAIPDGYGPGSGDPETRIDLTGTAEGKTIWEQILGQVPIYRSQLASGTIENSLVGTIN